MSGKEKTLSTVETIFPTPIYISKLDRNLNENELKFLNEQKKHVRINETNYSTINNFILNEKELLLLKEDLETYIDDFFYNKLKYNKKAKPYITQSWLNTTNKNQAHHQHEHPNSFLSGVYYVKANRDFDKIQFYNTNYKALSPNINDFNIFNSNSWWFVTETNNVFIFPSSTSHAVLTKNDDNERISIAFNIFLKGELGITKDLTYLKL
jgi:uncharacterized protein (TIGR02466 family)